MRKILMSLVAGATALSGLVLAAGPAAATSCPGSTTECTNLSVAVSSGTLSLAVSTAGTTVSLGSGSVLPLAVASGSLGTTTVTDTRGSSTGWTASAAATDFSDGTSTIPIAPNASLTAAAATGSVLPVTCGTGVLAVVPAVSFATETSGVSTETTATCVLATGATLIGANTAEWAETFNLTVPASTPSGTYTATITQTAA